MAPADRYKPDFQDDVGNVQGFAATIRENSEVIAYSLCCAAALAQLGARDGRAAPTYRALETLSVAYRFVDLSSTQVMERLSDVWNDLRAYRPLPSLQLPRVTDAASTTSYFEAVGRVTKEIRSFAPAFDTELANTQRAAWNDVRNRYAELARDRPEPPPTLAEVVCGLAELSPSSVLGFSIRSTPAMTWASLVVPGTLTEAARETLPIPSWAPAIAVNALGFRGLDRDRTTDLLKFLGALPWGEKWDGDTTDITDPAAFLASNDYLLSRPPQPQAVFVIRRERESLVAAWPTCANVATLPLTKSQVETLIADRSGAMKIVLPSATLPSMFRSSSDCAIAVEYPPDAEDVPRLANTLHRALSALNRQTSSPIPMVGFGPQEMQGDREPYIPAPGRYEDLVPASLFHHARSSRA